MSAICLLIGKHDLLTPQPLQHGANVRGRFVQCIAKVPARLLEYLQFHRLAGGGLVQRIIHFLEDGPDGDGPPLVCIDPGHGGDASGAVGSAGTLEKDINLDISKYLADDLRKAGVQIIMTRDSDVAVDLHERAAIANRAKADVFVCVHNNAATDTDSNGTETFYWGDSAEWSSEGKTLAEILQRHLIAALGSYDRGAKTHWYDLVVLAETDMPAALCECGFLTNPSEETKLLTPDYQQAAAQAICDGVLEYLNWSTTVYSTES